MKNNIKLLFFSENYDKFESILGSALCRQFISVLFILGIFRGIMKIDSNTTI